MNRTGILYDVGQVMGVNWHPHSDPKVVHRERSVLKNDLHCTAVKLCGLDIPRLMLAAEEALAPGDDGLASPYLATTTRSRSPIKWLTKGIAQHWRTPDRRSNLGRTHPNAKMGL